MTNETMYFLVSYLYLHKCAFQFRIPEQKEIQAGEKKVNFEKVICFEKRGRLTELLDIFYDRRINCLAFFETFWSFSPHRTCNQFFSKQIRHIDFGRLLRHFLPVKMSNLGRIISANGTRKLLSQYSRPAVSSVWAKQVK